MSYYTAEGVRRSVRQLDAYRRHLLGLVFDYSQQETFSGTYMAVLRLVSWMAEAPGTESFFETAPVLREVMRSKCVEFRDSPICGKRLRGLVEVALRRLAAAADE